MFFYSNQAFESVYFNFSPKKRLEDGTVTIF